MKVGFLAFIGAVLSLPLQVEELEDQDAINPEYMPIEVPPSTLRALDDTTVFKAG
ncbi:hypothetical protein DSO57_1037338 [Entomophthora muscae]|uniref:Uncharacterized protein n=1 Tax=Entomophthora muscae TaxID=34485 RepID=A0ACC2SBY5_9FUNG|nr:hypothetical protein DSO57_1037338 [Entomophthora muscae]